MAWVKPSRLASWRRRPSPWTGLTSPASPTSPKARNRFGSGFSNAAEATAMATARSAAGSVILTPPTVAT